MGDEATGDERIGIICDPNHQVFGVVAETLRKRGYDVEFLEPGVEQPRDRLDRLTMLVNKKARWESLDALEYAERNGIKTWNGYVASLLLFNRVSQLGCLAAAGFRIPSILTEPPDGDYVAKGFIDIGDDPVANGTGDFYQRLLDADGPDHKYYAVHDGNETHTAVVRFDSKLHGERERLGPGTIDTDVAVRIERLLDFLGARALGVDVIRVDDRWVAVDSNPATSFKHTGLETPLADSIEDALRG
ncbi:hypothetical protein ZOD2009_08419 [Haladaptatus paucihalophilus DX253]|uniref:Ribosomal protein S6--L-glutamate ligase n=1 Tax=Haladaptatus paucihalophilus DX253 TaxID=797209 RepID=E7QSB1_HALPU|nr:hypothetical protein [Haladaptatus paucihalophilus]EFW92880.1 hypothetical protein ZOD2009_08419 [Haladaptatus paucihalophilus DX253]SHK10029.1 hypothetical protein SAMN05444342_0572 [Haladaptatus paucihalophilus DX253]